MNPRLTVAIVLTTGLSVAATAAPPVGKPGRKYQDINIIHPVGAVCGFARDGTLLEVIKTPGIDTPVGFLKIPGVETQVGFETDMIDITDSRGDLTLTCTRADGWTATRTLIYGPQHYTSFNGPCGSPSACPPVP